jgi:aryl-alcohol dehydrogenase-like predicted oxidoreductase
MAQIATAWCLHKPGTYAPHLPLCRLNSVLSSQGVTAPIVGTTSLEHLMDAIESIKVKLSDEEIKYLEERYQPRGVMGHS